MAEFEVPTLDELHDLLNADYQARFPGADVSRHSDNWKRNRMIALAGTDLHAHVDQVFANLLPDEASGDALDRLGTVYNVERNGATTSGGTAALRVTGTAASTISIGDQLSHSDGTIYQINENETIPVAGYIDVDVISVDTGVTTNKEAGETLTFISPPAGINAAAELQLDLTGATDEEEDGPYRQRILDKIAQPGMGGNAEDYKTWALEVDGIADAFVLSGRNGDGTVDIVAVKAGSGSVRIPSTAEITEVQDYIDTKRPVSVKQMRVLTPVAETRDVTALLTPTSSDYEFDWDDSTPLVVSTWTSGTRTLVFTTARPSDMKVGDRIIIDSSAGDGSESVIEAFSSTNAVILEEVPALGTPASPNNVYAGGPLVAPARQDVIDLIDSLGPARGTYGALQWVGALNLADLYKTLQLIEGVDDTEVTVPASNATPTDAPPDDEISIFVPDKILIRRAH